MNILYTIKGVESTLSISLPEVLYLRLDWNSFDLCEANIIQDEDSYPKDMYNFLDISTSDYPLFSFIVCYKYDLLDHTDELDEIYNNIIEYYDPKVYKDNNNNIIIEAFYSENNIINPEELDDYVPPDESITP